MQLQRSLRQAVFFLPLFTLALATHAVADEPQAQGQFWAQVKDLVNRCSVQTYSVENGKKVYGPLESICPEVQVKGSQARFQLNNEWFLATIVDSEDSDGGDLNDVYVKDHTGAAFAERHEILAFGDILLGLAGGRVQLREQYVPDLRTLAQ